MGTAGAVDVTLFSNDVPKKKFPRFGFGMTALAEKQMIALPGQAPDLDSASDPGRKSPRLVPRHPPTIE